ncbi:MAG: DUF3014 domain-containing protein [Vicinamibacterales bacterium]
MSDLGDYRYQSTSNPGATESGRSSRTLWLVGLLAVAVGLAGAGVYLWKSRHPAVPVLAGQPATAPAATEAPRAPLGTTAEAIEVPPLPESDPVVRELVQLMSSHPQVAVWLATDGLIRNFTVVVGNVADGRTPAKQLGALKPRGPFRTRREADGMHVDPAGYARYDQLANAVASIDPQAAARIYTTLKPRLEEAHRELGATDSFDRTLEEAIVRLVTTPTAIDSRLETKGAEAYRYADPRLESMTDAQKLLLRMGPANARTVQEKLKAIGLALGIPTTRLGA